MKRAMQLLLVFLLLAVPAGAAEMRDLLRAKAAYANAADKSEPARRRYILKLVKLAKDFGETGEWDAFQAVRAEMLLHPAPSVDASTSNKALIVGPWEFLRSNKFFRADGTFATHAGAPGKWELTGNQFVQIGGVNEYEGDGSHLHGDGLKFTVVLVDAQHLILANERVLHLGTRLHEPKGLIAATAAFAQAGEASESARARYVEDLIRLRSQDDDDPWQYNANLLCLRLSSKTSDQDLAGRLPGEWVGAGHLRVYRGDGACKDESTGEHGTWRVENHHLVREMRDEEGFVHPVSTRVILLTRHELVTTDEKEVFSETRKSQ